MAITDKIRRLLQRLIGVQKTVTEMLDAGNLSDFLESCENYDDKAAELLKMYNPDEHAVNSRNAHKKSELYNPNQVPTPYQKMINKEATIFLYGQEAGKGLVWEQNYEAKDEAEKKKIDECFAKFLDVLKQTRNDSQNRLVKEAAGSQGIAGKYYYTVSVPKYDEEGNEITKEVYIKSLPISYIINAGSVKRQYKLRPMFDHLGNMIFFAFGYTIKQNKNTIECFDVWSKELQWHFRNGKPYADKQNNKDWREVNPYGLIPFDIITQDAEFIDVQKMAERAEELKNQISDVVDKFSDPTKYFQTDNTQAIEKLKEAIRDAAKTATSGGKTVVLPPNVLKVFFEDIPKDVDLKKLELMELIKGIFLYSYTLQLDYDTLMQGGGLSPEAFDRATALAKIKRCDNIINYGVFHDREKNIILSILKNVVDIENAEYYDKLDISFKFAEPFTNFLSTTARVFIDLVNGGLLSKQTAIEALSLVPDASKEFEQILKEQERERNLSELNDI